MKITRRKGEDGEEEGIGYIVWGGKVRVKRKEGEGGGERHEGWTMVG